MKLDREKKDKEYIIMLFLKGWGKYLNWLYRTANDTMEIYVRTINIYAKYFHIKVSFNFYSNTVYIFFSFICTRLLSLSILSSMSQYLSQFRLLKQSVID